MTAKTYNCKHCGSGGFTRFQIGTHSRYCPKNPKVKSGKAADITPGEPKIKRKWKRKQVAPTTALCYCPRCGTNLILVASALQAAQEVANGKG
jgi:hypothetical protein